MTWARYGAATVLTDPPAVREGPPSATLGEDRSKGGVS